MRGSRGFSGTSSRSGSRTSRACAAARRRPRSVGSRRRTWSSRRRSAMTEEDVERKLELVRRAGPSLTAGRSQRWRWAALSRLERKSRLPRTVVLAAAGVVAVVAAVGVRHVGAPSVSDASGQPRPAAPTAQPPDPRVRSLADGSRILLHDLDTVLEKRSETSEGVQYELESGTADFAIAPQR